MRFIRGYHIRWAFSGCIAGLVAYVGYRQYFLSTPSGRFETALAFIQTADKVELFETTDPFTGTLAIDAPDIPNSIQGPLRYVYQNNRAQFHRTLDADTVKTLIETLRAAKSEQKPNRNGFDPHHFVIATKGEKKAEIDISFGTSTLMCKGDIPEVTLAIQPNIDPARIGSLFGKDIFPQLEQIRSSLLPTR